jgi:hypothetical protein
MHVQIGILRVEGVDKVNDCITVANHFDGVKEAIEV